MSNDIALNILKDLMTKLIDKFDEMPRRQEVADDLTTLATAVTAIANKMNTPPRHEELKECVDTLNTEVKAVARMVGEVKLKINRFIFVAGIVVGLFFLVAIFTEVYTTIRKPTTEIVDTQSHKELSDKIDELQKKLENVKK